MKYLLLLSLLAIGCAEKPLITESEHPVTDYVGPHVKTQLCANAGVSGQPCDDLYEQNFKDHLLVYYGGTQSLFSACDSNPNLCRDELTMEMWFRNLRSFDKANWGWECPIGPDC